MPYLNTLNKLGPYCIVEANINSQARVRVVVEQNPEFLTKSLFAYFGREVTQLTLKEIRDFLPHLKQQLDKTGLIKGLFNKPAKQLITKKESNPLFYFDQLKEQTKLQHLFLAIVGQYLVERFTKREARLVPVTIERDDQAENHWAVFLFSKKKNSPPLFWDPSQRYPELNDHEITYQDLWICFDTNNSRIRVTIRPDDLRITAPVEVWNAREQRFGLIGATGQGLDFKVQGRSPAEKRFRLEEKLIEQAKEKELVPVELGFHPCWFQFGHTTLRIGESLYELTKHGWKNHHQGADKARAFIFNNPFAKKQLEKFAAEGMPPVSLGCSLLIEKQQLTQLKGELDRLVAAPPEQHEKFSLLFNNCNHGVMRALANAGVAGFSPEGYHGFSSVLSFRKTLLSTDINIDTTYLYPMPGTRVDEHCVRGWVPQILYRENSVSKELVRAWLRYPARNAQLQLKRCLKQLKSGLKQLKRWAKKPPENHTSYEVVER